jgi:uncharacterized protein YndB with AHSA1/START domain
MKNINLEIEINASREEVWDAIIDKKKYSIWTSAFQETSHFEGGWNKGDTIKFLAFSKEGQLVGMISEIAESKFPEFISIRHLGNILNGIVDTTSDEVKKWTPSYENYTLEKLGENKTLFKLEMETIDEYYEMFLKMWPNALTRLKEVCEENIENKTKITVEITINAPVDKVWEYWTKPEHIISWNYASDDWHCPKAENNLIQFGKFSYTMASKDGKISFDFEGVYTLIKEHETIQYQLGDGREVQISFTESGEKTKVVETFDAEHLNSVELQKSGWQAILENFKRHVEK